MTSAPVRSMRIDTVGRTALLVSGALALAVMLHAPGTPFWGDDYRFLYEATQAQDAGQPWWIALLDPPPDKFWRPLGEEMLWRVVAGPLRGDAGLAHGLVMLLWAAGALAKGACAALALRLRIPATPMRRAFLLGALAYAAHGAHGLTLAWVSAANSLLANLLVALAVAGWLAAWQRRGPRSLALSAAALLAFGLGLLCREVAIVAPALAALLALPLLRGTERPRAPIIRDLAASAALAAIWWWLRSAHVIADDGGYAMALGSNVAKNTGALLLFGLNVPRDALRFWIELREPTALVWAAACAALQLASIALFWRALPRGYRRGWALLLAAIAAVGAAPYFFLSGHGYPYYVGISLLALALLAAASAGDRRWPLAVSAALLSAALANGIEQRLPHPGLYARVAWAEASLTRLAALHRAHPGHFARGVVVIAEDPRDFYAIGPWGLAVRTGRPRGEVGVRFACSAEVEIVRMGRQAPPRLDHCPRGLPFVEWPD